MEEGPGDSALATVMKATRAIRRLKGMHSMPDALDEDHRPPIHLLPLKLTRLILQISGLLAAVWLWPPPLLVPIPIAR